VLQTLTSLNLECNNFGDEGAKHLSIALRSNKVRKYYFDMFYVNISSLMQTLTSLNLNYNGIEVEGIGCLSDALQLNTVRKPFV
jgi:hypothetical protein